MDIAPEVREAIDNYKTYHRDDFIEKNKSKFNSDKLNLANKLKK